MDLQKLIFRILAKHFRKPSGLLGRQALKRMNLLNEQQNDWVLSLTNFSSKANVLEIGFGSGLLLRKFIKTYPQSTICGIDASPISVKSATVTNQNAISRGKIKLVLGEAARLPFDNESFDGIIAVHVVYFWEILLIVFEEAYRCLKTDGRFLLYFVNPTLNANKHFINYSIEQVEQAMRDAHFAEIQINRQTFGSQNGICVIGKK